MLHEALIKEITHAHRQLTMFRTIHPTKELPKRLFDKVAYLRGYARALRALERNMTEDGISLDIVMRDVKADMGRLYRSFKR